MGSPWARYAVQQPVAGWAFGADCRAWTNTQLGNRWYVCWYCLRPTWGWAA